MADHDIIETGATWVHCRCGRTFDCETDGEARARHRAHHGVEAARASLAGRPRLELVPDPEGTD